MPCHSYLSWFRWMLVLPMTSSLVNHMPAVHFDPLHDVTNLHLFIALVHKVNNRRERQWQPQLLGNPPERALLADSKSLIASTTGVEIVRLWRAQNEYH